LKKAQISERFIGAVLFYFYFAEKTGVNSVVSKVFTNEYELTHGKPIPQYPHAAIQIDLCP
jgi:hypothetical protein